MAVTRIKKPSVRDLSILLTASTLIRCGVKNKDPEFANMLDGVIYRLRGSKPLKVKPALSKTR